MVGVVEAAWKIQERRLKCFDHVMRREESYFVSRASGLQVMKRRVKGRPKRRWKDCIVED